MEPFRDDDYLAAELRALRPEPRLEFAADLDQRAAAGFPRHSSHAASPLGRLLTRIRATGPRRALMPVGATALAAIAVATVVVAVSEPTTERISVDRLGPSEHFSETQPPASGASRGHSASGAAAASAGSSLSFENFNSSRGGSGPFVSKARNRDVERSAELVLGADPAEVGSDAAQVFDAVHAVDGIVLSSSVTGGAAGDAGARFDLLIPSGKLSDALAAFSAIDVVVSRHEATDDITAPTVRVGEHLRDSRATIGGLLVQLAGADSDEERAEIEARLRAERRHVAALRSRATKLDRRANLSRVSLRIETGGGAGAAGGGSWGVGDALGDAGHVLAIAAGVTIVALSILVPPALIGLLAWLANRARIRRGRERALV